MQHRSNWARFTIVLVGVAAGLGGCTGESDLSGSRIVADLERARVPLADERGAARDWQDEAALPDAGPITLTELLRVAEARNPSLAAARSGVGVAAGQRWQASLYPNPRTDALVEDLSWRDGFSGAKTTVGITQPIVVGGRRRAAIDAAAADQAAREAGVEAQRRALFGEIAAEHARLVSIGEQRRLYTELRELTGRTLAAASTRFEARAAPETDVIRPRVEAHRIDAALGRLGHEQTASVRRLGLLLGGVSIDASRIGGEGQAASDAVDREALEASVRSSHPALLLADREIEGAAARLEQVRAERTPDVDVRVAVGYRGEQDDGIVEFGAGMTLPLWDDRQGDVMSRRFELMRARQQRTAAENDLLGRLAASVGEYEAARAQLAAFRDQIVPDAQRAFDQTGEGYRGGRATFLDLLDTQRTLTEARVASAELAGAVAAARASILAIVGPDGLARADEPFDPVSRDEVPPHTAERPGGAEVKP